MYSNRGGQLLQPPPLPGALPHQALAVVLFSAPAGNGQPGYRDGVVDGELPGHF